MIDIALHAKTIAYSLLGEPNKKLSSSHELRFGKKGSLSIDLSKGTYFDHENQIGGGMIALIERERGKDNISSFLTSLGLSDNKLQQIKANGSTLKPKRYTDKEMRNLRDKSEFCSIYPENFVVMRFAGKVYRPFTKANDGLWVMKRPDGLLPLLMSDGDESLPCLIVEGEKAFLGAKSLYKGTSITWHGGVSALNQSDWSQITHKQAIIWPDNDDAGIKCANSLKKRLQSLDIKAVVVKPPEHFKDKDDLFDAYERKETIDILSYAEKNEQESRIVYQDYAAFKDKQYPPKVWIVEQLIARGHLIMIHGAPGHCKSLATGFLSMCLAAGYDFGHYAIEQQQKVLLIDAEMPPIALQERFASMESMFDTESVKRKKELIENVNKNLIIVSHHDQEHGLPPLNKAEGLEWFNELIERIDPDFIVLDNLLTLFQFEDGNQAEEWLRDVNPMLLKMRQQDRSVWFVHHSSKAGTQLGSMAKTVILDAVIQTELTNDNDDSILDIDSDKYETSFKWKFEKSRHFYGRDTLPVLWKYCDGIMSKDQSDIDMRRDLVIKLVNDGVDRDSIASQTGVSKRTIDRDIKELADKKMIFSSSMLSQFPDKDVPEF